MLFYETSFPKKLPRAGAKYPCGVLVRDNWDDFGNKTTFRLYFFRAADDSDEIGFVKILDRDNTRTEIPTEFRQLSETRFCSLGQSYAYYRAIARLGADMSAQLLRSLNDIVLNPKLALPWVASDPFTKSLLRESEAAKIWNEGKPSKSLSMHLKGVQTDSTSRARVKRVRKFEFRCQVPGASDEHLINFEFGTAPKLPDRQNVLIGKNATGKTQVLSQLAEALSRTTSDVGSFSPGRPAFSRIIAVSYSAFDEFRKPPRAGPESYRYCGIYTEEGELISARKQLQLVRKALVEIGTNDRERVWEECLKKALGEEQAIKIIASLSDDEPPQEGVLSSGHRILVTVLTQLLASIEEDALILFDEPELHLHPNATSGLIAAIHYVLREFRAYGIIATHSPIILQQTPSRFVRVFERTGNIPNVYVPQAECFGENLTAITEDIFYSRKEDVEYRRILSRLSKSLSQRRIAKLFRRPLSFNALTHLANTLQSDRED